MLRYLGVLTIAGEALAGSGGKTGLMAASHRSTASGANETISGSFVAAFHALRGFEGDAKPKCFASARESGAQGRDRTADTVIFS